MIFEHNYGLMDKCGKCGKPPGLEVEQRRAKIQMRGHCTKCSCCVKEWEKEEGLAIIAWNLEQRKGNTYERLDKAEDSRLVVERLLERAAKIKRRKAYVDSQARIRRRRQ